MENNTTKAKYPNPSLTRSRSILLKENSKSPPCITVGLRPQLEVFESANPLELKVIFLGEPLPLISWKKDNIPLSETMIKSKLNCSTLFLARLLLLLIAIFCYFFKNIQYVLIFNPIAIITFYQKSQNDL